MLTKMGLSIAIKDVLVGLNVSALFDNDAGLLGYVESQHVVNHEELLAIKNKLIEQGEMSQRGFELMLFNYGENDMIMSELRFGMDENV